MSMMSEVMRKVGKRILPTEEEELRDAIQNMLDAARKRGQGLRATEIAVQQMIESDTNVVLVIEPFSLGEDMEMREWEVTAKFRDGQTVTLTHHG